jgi:predicted metal-binding protein
VARKEASVISGKAAKTRNTAFGTQQDAFAVRKIEAEVPEGQLQEDLKKYRELALSLGASGAKIIAADTVVVDERVRGKCIYPICGLYGSNPHCPPNGKDLDFIRKLVGRYRWGIFLKQDVSASNLAGPDTFREKRNAPSTNKNFEIVGGVESAAFRDGYYLAVGFANSCCRFAFCRNAEDCSVLTGKMCRFPLQSRPSMESSGMDAYLMATRVGWDVYPLGRAACPPNVTHGVTLGLVLIY